MEKLSSKFSNLIHRKNKSNLLPEHREFLYSVLLMVENDQSNRFKGLDWRKLKSNLGSKVNINNDSPKRKIVIPEEIDTNTIYFKESNSVASNFLKSLRHAFAHNYITYNSSENELLIILPNRKKTGIKLYCRLNFDILKLIITELKKQQSKKQHL